MKVGEASGEQFTLNYFEGGPSEAENQAQFMYCLYFASIAHIKQRRKDILKTPYINHPIGVAYILAEEAGVINLDLLRGGLLHDTVEDTPVDIEMIRAKFGDYIGNLVQEVTDDKRLPKEQRKELQIKHAFSSSPQAKIVKLADKLYNLRDLDKSIPEGWTEKRREEYYKWAFKVCEGLRGVNEILEVKLDEIFKRKGLIHAVQCPEVKTSWPIHGELKPLVIAANFAAQRHSSHFVFDAINSDPYINHVISVAFIICKETQVQNIPVLCAAMLYSVIGKGKATVDELQDIFGLEIASLVTELTYEHTLTWEKQFSSQISRARNLSRYAKIITLATLIDKCRRLKLLEPIGWTKELKEKYFQWSYQLSTQLENTHIGLEKIFNSIWIGREVLLETKQGPCDRL